MKKLTHPRTMQRLARSWQREGLPVALVPTMGALHAGHASLIKHARRRVGEAGRVIVSLFVNPTQFGPQEDFQRYPRSEAADLKLCRSLGVDAAFAPKIESIYPSEAGRAFSTFVKEASLSQGMEGDTRPLHFQGVATVVMILFQVTQPSLAVFGEKDFQQAAVIKRMVRDLWLPIETIVSPTVREPDGLAISSRNAYLVPEERRHASILWQCIERARARVRGRIDPTPAAPLRQSLTRQIRNAPGAELDYIQFFDPDTLRPQTQLRKNHRIALAVRFGHTRLIDNGAL